MAAKPISELSYDKKPPLAELPLYPTMTSWFRPQLLLKLLWRVIVADLFGQYADRRLLEAALDTQEVDLAGRDDLSDHMVPDGDGAVWIDFVADLGDGFDATFAIASLLARPHLQLGDLQLPRGSVLVMGGDEVYPTATREEYNAKTKAPYHFAAPKPDSKLKVHRPKLLAIPGNHDWYDGLVNFLAFFCREKATSFGVWQTVQRRSYFGMKLTDNVWIWGIDIALVSDMDQPQADYFVSIAKAMPQNANVILCSAEPGWYGAEDKTASYRTLSYAAWIAQNAGKSIKIPVVLSGDTHHYSRYSSAYGTQYITSGGGGAFLHGTHQLHDVIEANWLKYDEIKLKLEACYPDKDESKRLLRGDLKFPLLNSGFSFFIGCVYAVLGFTLSMLWRGDVVVIEALILIGGFTAYVRYQEKHNPTWAIWGWSLLHAACQYAAMVGLTWLFATYAPFSPWHSVAPWWAWLSVVVVLMSVVGGAVAGFLYGLNLLLTCRYADFNHNDAFSAMRLDCYRNFLRIRLLGDQVTVYPIGLDRVPTRADWIDNPQSAIDPMVPYFIAQHGLDPHLIESPIVIGGFDTSSAATVKQPT
ncbi:metallophosphoesterase [Rhodopseudomonas sp. NSM]|uniref:metallophosphoesterase n=1 Tax=Rhodopseudomonas sp. NSM TaxID=3457630 RepID=UPI00403555B6